MASSTPNVKELAKRFAVGETEIKAYMKEFETIDANKDGKITAEELKVGLSSFGCTVSLVEAKTMIKAADANKDDKIDLIEFLSTVTQAIKSAAANSDQETRQAFELFDTNRDGYISVAELRSTMAKLGQTMSEKEATQLMKMYDSNKDGRMDYKEFLAAWKQMGGQETASAKVKELAAHFGVSEADINAYLKEFEAIDAKKDGMITADELKSGLATFGCPVTLDEAKAMVKAADTNKDDRIDLLEFLATVTRAIKAKGVANLEQETKQAFTTFDANRDGFISIAELRKTMAKLGQPLSDKEAAQLMKMYDRNKDGRMDYKEFSTAWKQMSGQQTTESVSLTPSSLRSVQSAKAKELSTRFGVSEEEINSYVKQFETIDVKKTGKITAEELKAGLNALGCSVTLDESKTSIRSATSNKDDKIDLLGFLSVVTRAIKAKRASPDQDAKDAFAMFDTNRDGFISANELRSTMAGWGYPITEKQAAQLMTRFDTNKDGFLDFKEFLVMWKQMFGLNQ